MIAEIAHNLRGRIEAHGWELSSAQAKISG